MSYILEALRRSQQARELGRVPTLDTSGIFEEDKVEPARVRWSMIAAVLAAVAVLVALYGVLREPGTPASVVTVAPAAAPAEPAAADAPGATDAAVVPPAAVAPEIVSALAAEPGVIVMVPNGEPLTEPLDEPLIEPPPPKGGRSAPGPAPAGSAAPPPPSRRLGGIPEQPIIHPHLSGSPQIDAEMERELQRQLDDEMAGEVPDYPERPTPTPIPRELIADIEKFKDSVREERGIPEPKRSRSKAKRGGDITKLRLTKAQKAGLPLFVITVHVFDKDPKRRFVVINGLKYREGETTDEGLEVEQITVEGVLLSHGGNPFFMRA